MPSRLPRPLMPRVPLLLALALGACAEGDGLGPVVGAGHSIVVVTLDTTRADMLGAYGSPLGVTPYLDELAKRAVLFENVYAPMPQTLPSHATVFTGLMPRVHGALENTYVLRPEVSTLAESATEHGYVTGGFIGALAIEAATGMSQGFQTWGQPEGVWGNDRKGHPPQRPADAVTDAALAWAGGLDHERPFLLWAHYYDPHGDEGGGFSAPARHLRAVDRGAVRKLVESLHDSFEKPDDPDMLTEYWAGYAAELRFTDEQVGRLLDGLAQAGLMDDTLVVVLGDHGEGLWEHGEKAHGTHLWEEMMRVPLLVVAPDGSGAGRRVAQRVTLQDVEPTVRRMAFGEAQATRDEMLGVDLWAAVLGERELPVRPIVVERPHYDRERIEWRGRGKLQYGFLTAILLDQWKLVRQPDGSSELYDLDADPDELVDVSAAHPEVTTSLTQRLSAWIATNRTGQPGEDVEISDERRETLRQLGYIGGDAPGDAR